MGEPLTGRKSSMAVLLGVRELPREGREALTTPALLGGSHAPSDTGM